MSRSWMSLGGPLRLLVLVPLLVGGGIADAQAPAALRSESLRVRLPASAGAIVYRAVHSLRRRLANEPCRLLLEDFNATASGRSLGDLLTLRSQTLEQHIESLVFKDGSGNRACASASVLAFTRVGSDTIYVCASRFVRATRSDPEFAELALIHEVLHTLGLGENPPSSAQITARVGERCGGWATSGSRGRAPSSLNP